MCFDQKVYRASRSCLPTFIAAALFFPLNVLPCERVRTPVEFLNCMQQNNPEILSVRAEAESAQDLVRQAGRLPNPEFQSQNLYGSSLGDTKFENQLGLMQTIQLGGKRGARRDVAKARANRANADRDVRLAITLEEGIAQLLRGIQIRQEIRATQAALGAYRRMAGNLRARSILSPEQRSTLALFQANLETLENSQNSLMAEQMLLRAAVSLSVGGADLDWSHLEHYQINRWPEFPKNAPNLSVERNPSLKSIAATRELALAEYDLESAEAWPDLTLGPMIQFNGDGPIQYQTYGFGLSFTLPVWDLRGPAKRAALRLSDTSQRIFEITSIQQSLLFKERKGAYELLHQRISDRTPIETFEKYLGSIESQFARGALGPVQVIEAYRQRIENLRSRFEIERSALSLLIDIWATLGQATEESLAWVNTSWTRASGN